ncbi:MAG: NAD+ synthase [Actinobacteria bacterium]|nr:NAD+ synthase [Actinomycetota bacterium]
MANHLRLALAQVNPTVGDFLGNARIVAEATAAAGAAGAHVLVFPEMIISGYPVEDLALRSSFRAMSKRTIVEVARRAKQDGFGEIVLIVGFLNEDVGVQNRLGQPQGAPQNAVAVIHQGEIKATYVKQHLPNYGVFDEFRNFVAGTDSLVVRIHGIDVGLAICEDIWQDGGAVEALALRKPGLVLVPNGSPFERRKDDARLSLVQKRARQIGAPLAYVNMIGGQDDLVFDGDTIVVDAQGNLLARSAQFEEALIVVDVEVQPQTSSPNLIIHKEFQESVLTLNGTVAARLDDAGEIWNAIVLGIRDYAKKNKFSSCLIALSGGIDSAIVASLAVDALGSQNVFGLGLPSKYSSDHSLSDAHKLAENTGLHFRVVEIEPIVTEFVTRLNLKGLAEENVQARVRGTTLMAISNQEGHLVLATGNKSELAVGYSTLYGDAVGGFAPIKDIYKTDVWALSRWRNEQAIKRGEVAPIPVNSINKEPSAELRPGQKDTDSLPDYLVLDEVLRRYVDEDEGAEQLIASGLDEALVQRVISMVDRAEYKRRQYPPGVKVSQRAFGKDRRLPITSAWVESS